MPYFSFKEIWTPLVLIRIRFYKCIESGALFVKIGNRKRTQITIGSVVFINVEDD